MKNIFVFDLDGTLGLRTSSYPQVSESNINYLRKLSSSDNNLLFFATGRPRSQAVLGLSQGGMLKEEVYKIFNGGVYEDGLFVESRFGVIYNALNDSSELFLDVKKGFFDDYASNFFKELGFYLFKNNLLRLRKEKGSYEILDYDEKLKSHIIFPKEVIPLYQQGNDVRETYKLPQGYLNDDSDSQAPIFNKVSEVTEQHLNSRFPGWQEVSKLEEWKDFVEIYPKLGTKSVFIKGEGIDRLLSKENLNKDMKAYICCDGRNDISLVGYFSKEFSDYHVVCPSNVSNELQKSLREGNFNHTILEQDCSNFSEGLERLIKDNK